MEPILSAAQRKRLAQIRLSVAGLQVLIREDIAQKLELSSDQRSRIETVLKEAYAAANGKSGSNGTDSSPAPEKPTNNASAKVAAILSRDQLVAARELLGPPLDAAKLGAKTGDRIRLQLLYCHRGWQWSFAPVRLARARLKDFLDLRLQSMRQGQEPCLVLQRYGILLAEPVEFVVK